MGFRKELTSGARMVDCHSASATNGTKKITDYTNGIGRRYDLKYFRPYPINTFSFPARFRHCEKIILIRGIVLD